MVVMKIPNFSKVITNKLESLWGNITRRRLCPLPSVVIMKQLVCLNIIYFSKMVCEENRLLSTLAAVVEDWRSN